MKKISTIAHYSIATALVVSFLAPASSFAQGAGLSLTVAPPLFQFTLTPGESWASSIKIVNGNAYDITVYATPVNFTSVGEDGRGKFLPLSNEDTATSPHSLGGWIDVTRDPIYIPKGDSVRVPFFVLAPENAEPGGHYASILIGTRPPEDNKGGSEVKVSSVISTLLFARVSGDVVEEGRIRQFSTEKSLYQTPEANVILRFENIGNVHLIPRGNIIIYNMWGKERGRIDVNRDANFGNVFPGSIRNFSFSWKGESNFYDIGRYKAIATLSYGAGETQSDFQELSFWVVPIKPLLWILGTFIIFITFIFLALRRYVKHALKMQTELLLGSDQDGQRRDAPQQKQQLRQVSPVQKSAPATVTGPQKPQKVLSTLQILKQPVIQGSVDLRRAGVVVPKQKGVEPLSTGEFMKKYKTFLIFTAVFIACVVVTVFFLRQVMVKERNFDIKLQDAPSSATTTAGGKIES